MGKINCKNFKCETLPNLFTEMNFTEETKENSITEREQKVPFEGIRRQYIKKRSKSNPSITIENNIIKEKRKEKSFFEVNSEATENMFCFSEIEHNSEIINQETNRPLSPIRKRNENNFFSEYQTEEIKIDFDIDENHEKTRKITKGKTEHNKNKEIERVQSKILKYQSIFNTKENIKKLKNLKKSQIIYHGELRKMISDPEKVTGKSVYSNRFCTVSYNYFTYYKSKENFLMKKRPIGSIPINKIIDVNFVNIKKNPKIDHIMISKKIDVLTSKKENDFLIFTSKDDSIYKWFIVLQHCLGNL